MELFIFNETTLGEINKAFQKRFPFLKMEFYYSDYLPGQMSLWDNKLCLTARLGQIFSNFHPVIFGFRPTDTVKKFKENFEKEVGLIVEIFRRSDHRWIEVSESLESNLEKQNAFGGAKFHAQYNDHTLFL